MANDIMRLAGLNSGYDTEAMIQKMMTSYQTKIDNQNKKLTKLTWQQEAYRDITEKLTAFKGKYFDLLNKQSYLLSPSSFNKFSTAITGKTLLDKAKGLNVTTTVNSVEGKHSIKVSQLAAATTAKGKTITPAGFGLDMEKAAKNSSYTENDDGTRTYNFSLDVKVGDVSKTVEFKAENIAVTDGNLDMDAFTSAVETSLNDSLKEAFGKTGIDIDGTPGADDVYFLQATKNADGNLAFEVNGNAAVTVTEKDGSFGLTKLAKQVAVSAQSAVTGKNTLAVNVNGTVKNVTFDGVSDTYYDSKDLKGNEDILKEYNALKEAAYRKENKLYSFTPIDEAKLKEFTYTSAQAAKDKNTASLETALNKEFRSEGVTFDISDKGYVTGKKSGMYVDFSMTSVEGGTLGLEKGNVSNRFTAKTKLTDMGIDGNNIVINPTTGENDQNYSFEINGKKIELNYNATVNDLVEAVNKSGAGVTMTYSNLTNSFEIKSNNMGAAEKITFGKNQDGTENRILKELGLLDAEITEGRNAVFEIDGVEIYHNSNSYVNDGTTYNFTEDMELGEVYEVSITKNYDDIKQTIRDFVKDYNQLIDDVYGHIGQAPVRDNKNRLYEPLTDAEKEEMDDKQIEKWETAAKKGVIYNDPTVSSIMSQLRTALYNSVTLDDGSKFSLINMGIKTASYIDDPDLAAHGKLTLDEDKLTAAFEKNADAVLRLFTDTESSVMKKVSTIIDNAVRTTGKSKGTLINKAGLEKGTTAKDNHIYRQMQQIQKRISQLQDRYDSKENYWWKVFTNLESIMSKFNDQSTQIAGFLNNFGSNQQ